MSLTRFRFSFTRIVLFRMITTFPARRDLVLFVEGDSIGLPQGPYDHGSSYHVSLIFACKLPFCCYGRFGIILRT